MLEIPSSATNSEISTAYKTLSSQLKLKESILGVEETALKQKVFDLAYNTLSVETSRLTYDAKLSGNNQPLISEIPIKYNVAIEESAKSPLRRVLVIIAGVMVIWLSLQIIFALFAYRNTQHPYDSPSDIVSQSEEKVRMQEYYQEHGVRAGSRIEADLLDKEQQHSDALNRQKENEKKEQQRKYDDFVRESRRVGDQVSYNLRMAEETARQNAEREQRLQEEEKLREKEAERMRIEQEKSKWKSGYSSGSSYNNNYSNEE